MFWEIKDNNYTGNILSGVVTEKEEFLKLAKCYLNSH